MISRSRPYVDKIWLGHSNNLVRVVERGGVTVAKRVDGPDTNLDLKEWVWRSNQRYLDTGRTCHYRVLGM